MIILVQMSELTPIVPDYVYVVEEVARQFKIGKQALRKARQHGLKVKYWGKRAYVRGSDLIEHIFEHGDDQRYET